MTEEKKERLLSLSRQYSCISTCGSVQEWVGVSGSELEWAGVSGSEREWAGVSGSELEWDGLSGSEREWARVSGSELEWAGVSRSEWEGAEVSADRYRSVRENWQENDKNQKCDLIIQWLSISLSRKCWPQFELRILKNYWTLHKNEWRAVPECLKNYSRTFRARR